MNNKRQRYTEKIKQDAVDPVNEKGYSGNEVAKRLGLTALPTAGSEAFETRHKTIPQNNQYPGDMAAELKQLRKENKRLLIVSLFV